MNTNRSTICVHEHAAERNANVCLNCKGQWERKIMNKENKLVIRILKRILLLAVVMFLLSVVVFWLARLAPGDPLQSFYGDSLEMMTSEEVAAARTRLGLDQGIGVQYVRWFTNVVHGDFGLSLKYRQPVMNVIRPLIGNTLVLGGIAYIVIFILAVLIAIFCTLHEDQWIDRLICKIGTAAYYVPAFWLGVVLILIFSVNLGWFPSSGAYDVGMADSIGNRMKHMILPLVVMIFSHLWYYAYMIRNKFLDEVRKDYVLLARSKGLSKRKILWKHCLRNVMPTIVSIMAVSVPHVTGGTVTVEAVFNYDLPQDDEYYVHRIGRTGRAGRCGKAFSFVKGKEVYKLKDIQRYCKTKIYAQPIPSSDDVAKIRAEKIMDQISTIIDEENLTSVIDIIENQINESDYTAMDIAAAFLYQAMGASEISTAESKDDYDFHNTGAEDGMVRLFINVGKKDKIKPGDILGAIAGESGMPGRLVGAIDMYDKYTFVEVPAEYGKEVLNAMKNAKIKGRSVNMEPANSR